MRFKLQLSYVVSIYRSVIFNPSRFTIMCRIVLALSVACAAHVSARVANAFEKPSFLFILGALGFLSRVSRFFAFTQHLGLQVMTLGGPTFHTTTGQPARRASNSGRRLPGRL